MYLGSYSLLPHFIRSQDPLSHLLISLPNCSCSCSWYWFFHIHWASKRRRSVCVCMYERDILPTTVSLTIFAQYQNYWHSIDQTVATKVHATGVRCYNIAIYNKRIEPISFVFVSSSLRTAPYLAMVAGLWSLHCSCIVTGVAKINLRKKKNDSAVEASAKFRIRFFFLDKGTK